MKPADKLQKLQQALSAYQSGLSVDDSLRSAGIADVAPGEQQKAPQAEVKAATDSDDGIEDDLPNRRGGHKGGWGAPGTQGAQGSSKAKTPKPGTDVPWDAESAYAAALRLLTHKDRTTKELAQKLRERGVPPEVIEPVMQRIANAKLIDDTNYAQRYALELRRKGNSSRRIRQSLQAKGLEAPEVLQHPDEFEAAAQPLDNTELDLQQAVELALKRAERDKRMLSGKYELQGQERRKIEQRLAGFLQRKGYSGDVTRAAIEQAIAHIQAED